MPFQLAQEQTSIVNAPVNCNIKVIAVPGSGKSTVLVYRVGHMLETGIEADRILVVMFNDSAAVNFRVDLEKLEYMHLPEVRTYHSFAKKIGFILEKSGVIPKQTFTPESYKYKLFYKDCLVQYIPTHLHQKMQVGSSSTISLFTRFNELCKSSLLEPKDVFIKYKYPDHLFPLIDAYLQSEIKRKAEKIQFFPDLIYDLIVFHEEHPDLIRRFINKYDVVMVDEYQDANAACHKLVKMIAGKRACINVVGDDDQTIYDFTGASPRFLKNEVDNDFDDVKLFKLTKTYRYGHTAALVANNIIHNNNDRIDKLCISGRDDLNTHFSIAHYDDLYTDTEQTDLINEIKQFLLNGGKYSDIAILVRNYSSTFSIELALLRSGFPYFINKESKTILDSANTLFLNDMLTVLSESPSKVEKCNALQRFLTSFLWDIDRSHFALTIDMILLGDAEKSISAFTDSYSSKLSKEAFEIIGRRIKAVHTVLKSRKKETGYLLNRLFKEARFESYFNKKRNGKAELKRISLLLNFYSSLNDDVDVVLEIINGLKTLTTQSEGSNAIQFCTLHKSKGLAWPYIIMAHCEEGICPSFDCGTDPYQIEVERRLFYVGITRVRNKLTLHLPRDDKLSKSLKGFTGYMDKVDNFTPGYASRFVYESNLLSAVQIGVELYRKTNKSDISTSGNRQLYNSYLEFVDVNYRISGLGAEL